MVSSSGGVTSVAFPLYDTHGNMVATIARSGSGFARQFVSHSVRARHYGAQMGAWTSVDLLWPGERAYGYVGNRVTVAVDPSGMESCPRQDNENPDTDCFGFIRDKYSREKAKEMAKKFAECLAKSKKKNFNEKLKECAEKELGSLTKADAKRIAGCLYAASIYPEILGNSGGIPFDSYLKTGQHHNMTWCCDMRHAACLLTCEWKGWGINKIAFSVCLADCTSCLRQCQAIGGVTYGSPIERDGEPNPRFKNFKQVKQ